VKRGMESNGVGRNIYIYMYKGREHLQDLCVGGRITLKEILEKHESRDSNELDGQVSIIARGKRFFYSPVSRPSLGPAQSHIQWVPEAIFPGIKWPEREDEQSL
jgi:hypothetical protein